MPVFRIGNNHRINVFILVNPTHVFNPLGLESLHFFQLADSMTSTAGIYIADVFYFNAFAVFVEIEDHGGSPTPCANQSQDYFIVGPFCIFCYFLIHLLSVFIITGFYYTFSGIT